MIVKIHIINEGEIFECKYEADDLQISEGVLYVIKDLKYIAGFAPGKWLFYELGDVRIE